jgi:hypothetical protein
MRLLRFARNDRKFLGDANLLVGQVAQSVERRSEILRDLRKNATYWEHFFLDPVNRIILVFKDFQSFAVAEGKLNF